MEVRNTPASSNASPSIAPASGASSVSSSSVKNWYHTLGWQCEINQLPWGMEMIDEEAVTDEEDAKPQATTTNVRSSRIR